MQAAVWLLVVVANEVMLQYFPVSHFLTLISKVSASLVPEKQVPSAKPLSHTTFGQKVLAAWETTNKAAKMITTFISWED